MSHDLYNADCLTILPKIASESIDLIIADPPYYGVIKEDWDNQWKDLAEHLDWSKQWISECIRVLKPSGSIYIWGGVGERSDTIIHIKLLCDSLGLYFKDWITWKKSRGMGTRKGWVYAREECLWYVKDNKKFVWNTTHQYGTERRLRDKGLPDGQIRVSQNGHYAKSVYKRLTSVWTDISEQTYDIMQSKAHYTPKPLKAIERIIRVHTTDKEQIVLDPFLGSGTTAQVCTKLGLKCIGIEKNTTYFEEAVKHIEREIH